MSESLPTKSDSLRLLGVSIDHPGAHDRALGHRSKTYLQLITPAGRARAVELSEDDLIRLIRQASTHLATLRGIR